MLSVSDLPTLNAILNFTSAVLLATGFYFIKKRRIEAHKKCMIAAVFVSVAFLTSYLIYHKIVGSVPFERTGWLPYVYYPILATHVILAMVNLPMVLRTVYLGWQARYTSHVAIARWTFPIWMYVSVTGVVVYLMLYHL
jgi:putative membrane protein